ncbi:MAG: hypothetical protein DYG89_13610 [Caldilinea sp. CFX5]|nr:hypothetical protein [Caldilinea sp. CFX5]
MNPHYFVRTAPSQPESRLAFSAFSIRPAQAELFDVAHVLLLAEAVDDTGATIPADGEPPVAPSSHQALRLIRRIMQQETALPVVRRLVEALRQANVVLYNEQQGARIIAGVLVKNTLYLTCVGAMGAYIIRNEKVAVLLQAERTRAAYLGQTLQLQLDYQLPTAAALFAEAQTPHAYLITDRFLLAPGDSVIFCSTELPLATIKPALIYTRRPERLATHLADTTLHRTGQTPGVIALHWHVDRAMQTVKQVALVFFIFFCVTAAMQGVIFVNQQLEQWLTLQRGATPVHDLPPILYDTAAALENNNAVATPGARTSVQVNVDVNVAGQLPQVNPAVDSAPPAVVVPVIESTPAAAALVPVVAADILLQQPTPTAIQLASASLEQVPQEASPALVRSADDAPVAQGEQPQVARPQVERQARTKLLQPTPAPGVPVVALNATVAPATPTMSPLALLPIAATPTNTAMPTATPTQAPPPSPTPTTRQATNTPALPTATTIIGATATPTVPPTATPTLPTSATAATAISTEVGNTPAQSAQSALAGPAVVDSVTLLAPPEQTSSSDLLTFAWQGQTPLPAGQAYEVIVWRPGQTPLADGLGIAPPDQSATLTVQLRGLHEAGIIQPGAYQWGVLLVTVEPYSRLTLLSPERTFYFAGPDQAPRCNPDRETC